MATTYAILKKPELKVVARGIKKDRIKATASVLRRRYGEGVEFKAVKEEIEQDKYQAIMVKQGTKEVLQEIQAEMSSREKKKVNMDKVVRELCASWTEAS